MMNGNTILGSDLLSTKEKQYDEVCKRLLSQKVILAHILKACVPEFKDATIEDITNKYIEGIPEIGAHRVNPNEANAPLITGNNTEDSSINEGKVVYDIIFNALAPQNNELIKLIINVEAQRKTNLPYHVVRRALYYCCRLISSQYGREFTHSEYQKIKKVYSIWINTGVSKEAANTINSYSIKETNILGDYKLDPAIYDIQTVITINTTSEQIEALENNIIKLLSVLLTDNLKPDTRMRILENDFNIPMTESIESGVSDMCNLSEGIGLDKYEKGRAVGLAEGETRGRAAGLAEGETRGRAAGRAEGEARGRIAGVLESLKALIANGNYPPEQAMNLLNVPQADRAKLLAQL